jgi:NitT/TauT family transport system substrate-binding protein
MCVATRGKSVIRKLAIAAILCLFATLPAAAATKINFMYTAVAQFFGLYVAKDQGILAKHGLDTDMTLTTNGSLISAALVADTAQLGGPTPTMAVSREQGLIRGNPDPKSSLIYPRAIVARA